MTASGIAPAGYFDEFYGERGWEFYSWLLARVVQYAPPGPILDLGAGAGLFLEAAHRWGLPCIGLEGSTEGVARARGRVPELDVRHGLLGDPLPFEASSFGSIVLNQVVEHLDVATANSAAAEAYRCLRPGGLLVVTSPSRFNRREARADPTHVNLYAPRELRALLERRGFRKLTSFDEPLPLFGTSSGARFLARAVFRLTPLDRFSATANVLAFKPEEAHDELI